jgi:CRISPR-associated endonuclease Csn1
MEHIWGFDIGTTSIGFAVVRHDDEKRTGTIVREGVRIFPEGREEKKLEPRNQARRAARLLRRQIRRRRLRRKLLREAFAAAGLLPPFDPPQWDAFMNGGADPYQLRARGLREPLEPLEIGRA